MCQWGRGYSLWLSNDHEQEHPDATSGAAVEVGAHAR